MMRSATAFLPDSMITFMNFERSTEPNFGSGRMSRLGTSRRRGMTLFLWLQLAPTCVRASGHHQRPTYSAVPKCRHEIQTRYRPGSDDLLRADGPTCCLCEGLSLLRPLCAVLRTRLLAILDALQVER